MAKGKPQPKWTYGNADINEAIARRFAEEAAQQPAQSPTDQPSPTPPQGEYNPNRFRYDQPATMQAVQEGIKRGELVRDNDNRVFRTRPKKDNPKEREQEKEALYNIAKGKDGVETIAPRVYGNVEQAQNPEMEFNRIATGEQGDEGFFSGLSSKMKALSQYLTVPSVIPSGNAPIILPKPIPLTDEARRKAFAESRGKTYLPTTEPRGVGATVGEIAGDLGVGAAAMLATGGSGAAALVAGAAIPEAITQLGRYDRQEASGAEAVGRTLVAGAAGALQAGITSNAAKAVAQGSAPLRAKLTEIAGKQGQMLGAQALRSVAAVAKEGGLKMGAKIVGQNVGVAAGQAGANAALEGVADSTPDEPVRQAMNGDVLPLAKDIATQTAFGTVGGLAFSPLDVNASALLKSMPATKSLLSTSQKQVAEAAIESATKQQVQNEAAQQAAQQATEQAAIAARTFNPEEFPLAIKEATALSKLQRQAGIDPRLKQGINLVTKSFGSVGNPATLENAMNVARSTGIDVDNTNALDVAKQLVELGSGLKPLEYVRERGTPTFDRLQDGTTVATPFEKQLAKREINTFIQEFVPNTEDKQALIQMLVPNNKRDLTALNPTQLDQQLTKAFAQNKGTKNVFETLFKPQETPQVTPESASLPEISPESTTPVIELVPEPPILSTKLQDHPKPDIASPASNPTDNVAPKMAYISEPVTPKDIARITEGADYRKDWEARGITQGTPEFDAMLAKRTDIEKKANMNARILGLDATRVQAPHLDDMYYGKPLLRSAREAEREVGKVLTQVENEGKTLQKQYGKLRQKNNKLLEAVAETNFRQYEEYLAVKNDIRLNDVERERALERIASGENLQKNLRESLAKYGMEETNMDKALTAYKRERARQDAVSDLEYTAKFVKATGLTPSEIPARVETSRARVPELRAKVEAIGRMRTDDVIQSELKKLDKTMLAKQQLGEPSASLDGIVQSKQALEQELGERQSLNRLREELADEQNILDWHDGRAAWVQESSRSAYFDQWTPNRTGYRVRIAVPATETTPEFNYNHFVKSELNRDGEANEVLARLVNEGKITKEQAANAVREELYDLSPATYEKAEDIVRKALKFRAPEAVMRYEAGQMAGAQLDALKASDIFTPEQIAVLKADIDAFVNAEPGVLKNSHDLFAGEEPDAEKILAVQSLRNLLEGGSINRDALAELLRRSSRAPVPKRVNKGVAGWRPEEKMSWEFLQNSLDARASRARSQMVSGSMLGEIGRQRAMFEDVGLQKHNWYKFLERKTTQLRGGDGHVLGGNRYAQLAAKGIRKGVSGSTTGLLTFAPKSGLRNALDAVPATVTNLLMHGSDLSPTGILKSLSEDNRKVIADVWKNLQKTGIIHNVSTDFLPKDTFTGRRWEAKLRNIALVFTKFTEQYVNRAAPALLYSAGRAEKLLSTGSIDLNDPVQYKNLVNDLTDEAHSFIATTAGEFSREMRAANFVKFSGDPIAHSIGTVLLALQKPVLSVATLYGKALHHTLFGMQRMKANGDIETVRDLSGLIGVFVVGGGLMGFKQVLGMKDVVTVMNKVQEFFNDGDHKDRITTASLREQTDMAWQKIKEEYVKGGADAGFMDQMYKTVTNIVLSNTTKDVVSDGAVSTLTGYDFSSDISLLDRLIELPSTASQAKRIFEAGKGATKEQTADNIIKLVKSIVPTIGNVANAAVTYNRGYEVDPSGAPKQAKGGEGTDLRTVAANAVFGQRMEDKKANEAQRLDRVPLETALQRRDFAQSLLRLDGLKVGSDYAKSEIVQKVERDAKKVRTEIYDTFHSPDVKKSVEESKKMLDEFLKSEAGQDYLRKAAGYAALGNDRRAGSDKQYTFLKENAARAIKDYYLSLVVSGVLKNYDERVSSDAEREVYKGIDENDPNTGQYIESFPPEERGFRYALHKMGKRGESNSKKRLEKYMPTVGE